MITQDPILPSRRRTATVVLRMPADENERLAFLRRIDALFKNEIIDFIEGDAVELIRMEDQSWRKHAKSRKLFR